MEFTKRVQPYQPEILVGNPVRSLRDLEGLPDDTLNSEDVGAYRKAEKNTETSIMRLRWL